MKIKKSFLDTYLIVFLMVAVVLPTFLAKPLILFFTSLIVLKILFGKDLFLYSNQKILIFIFLLPGILLSLFFDLKEALRYSVILIIVLGFPYYDFKIRFLPILITSILILLYLISSQMLIATGNQLFIDYREFGYKNEFSYIWNYGIVSNLIEEILNFGGGVRSGGLYYNPNQLAGIIVLNFFIYNATIQYQKNINKFNFFFSILNNLILVSVSAALLLAESRTVLITFIIFFFIQYVDINKLLKFKFRKEMKKALLILSIVLVLIYESVIRGIVNVDESFYIKFEILINYINQIKLNQFFFGGTFDIHFDTEYGMLFGALGICGLFAFFILLRLIYKNFLLGKETVIAFLLMGMGTTLFLNLQKISIILILLILLSRLTYLNDLNNKDAKNK